MSWWDSLSNHFLSQNLLALAGYLTDANKRIYLGYLLGALVLALPLFWRSNAHKTPGGLFRFLFPAHIYRHRSTRHDVGLWVINRLIRVGLLAPVVLTMVPIALGTTELLEWAFGTFTPLAWSATTITALFTLALFVADDFSRFFLHWLMHRIPVLWDFHKVHHSAEVLTPMTIYRSHPLESYLYACRMALTQGIVVGLGYYLFGPVLTMQDILGANVFVFLFNVMGSNLRHSHLWLSWGDRLEDWFISPAQHQVHHSAERRHWDTNMGSALAIWDRMWGTLVKASDAGEFRIGSGDDKPGHDTLLGLYLTPFKDAFRRLRPWLSHRPNPH
ncbi:fatty acid hydroxylase [Ferrimonas balearica DSM 9799]|uniref:Fatty acid hydroxylase n=1 Tax=Ferrimonas balearica (strain DSM 9799 / CCM 4581 / KCTC 23876 / PAT) TaxID=550540 RepID=E1SWC9_FERBD|nr:sterol desaturase family protein [Ferrimonas balearica]ADN75418.1 fatty acid hydroxylase [Ferrimonas balearica DSM 9799]